jgi:hypothetical protein
VNADSPLVKVVRSLHFQEDQRNLLRDIPESAWPKLLRLTDDARLTLPLAIRCAASLPGVVRERVERNLQSNLERHARVIADWQEIAGALASRGVEFTMLKGLSHGPLYCDYPAHRPQYDFDLYCPEDSIAEARDAIAALGYEPLHAAGGPATDHLPAMIRKTGYQWRGDYFDPALPLTVELHYRFWDAGRESIRVRSAERFRERRTIRSVGDLEIPALHPIDCLSYATWHAVRHLFAGNLRPYHIYELAHFLDRTQDDHSFWREWAEVNAGPVVAEQIAFRLAVEWFGCGMHPAVRKSVYSLSHDMNRWFGLFAFSPVQALEHPNKDELFLHLCLVPERRARFRIAAHRVFPHNPPQKVWDAHTSSLNRQMKLRRAAFRARHIGQRAWRHLTSLLPVTRSALLWWRTE